MALEVMLNFFLKSSTSSQNDRFSSQKFSRRNSRKRARSGGSSMMYRNRSVLDSLITFFSVSLGLLVAEARR